jgi:2-polyprenyl-6-methoxyphenol hydroxylase-like FAD-dependent oxidoreductase
MSDLRTALIIGGGIAGPVTALALQKAGIESTVYEAYSSTADGIGGMLTLAPNGLDALRVIGADNGVRDVGVPMNRMVMTDGHGRPMGTIPGLAGLPPSQAMSRPDLYRFISDQAVASGVRIESGKRLAGVEEGSGGIIAQFDDGSTAEAEILIGCDGTHSTVRTLIDPAAPPPGHVPLLNFGGVADISVAAEPDTTYFMFGKRAFLGYWALPDGTTAWFSNLPHAQPMTLREARERPTAHWLEVLREAHADDVPAADLMRKSNPDLLMALGSTEILMSVPRWHRGRMVLVGDAVHAPSPSSGQGASLAIESAVQLARCLRDIPDLTAAFGSYERLRRPRVESVATRAARVNNSKALGPVAIGMMRLLMPLMMRTMLTPERTLGMEQRYRIDWEEQVEPSR